VLFAARKLQGQKARSGQEAPTADSRGGFAAPLVNVAMWSIALGVAVMVISVCVLRGFQGEIRRKAVGFGSHIMVKSYAMGNTYEDVPVDTRREEVDRIRHTEGVRHVQFYATKGGMVKTDDQIEGVLLRGVDRGYDSSFFAECMVEGRLFHLPDSGTGREVIVSKRLAERLKIGVGDKLRTYFWQGETYRARAFEVSGIYSTDLADFDAHYVVGDLRQVQQLNGWEQWQAGGYEVLVDDFGKLADVGQRLKDQLGYDLTITTIIDQNAALFAWLDLLDSNVVLIIAVMMMVCVVSVISALLIFIFEKTSTIGVLKALGATGSTIGKIFVLKGAVIALKGIAIGEALAMGLCALQQHTGWVRLDPESYAMTTVPVALTGGTAVAVAIGTLAVCVLAMLIPAAYIASVEPAKTIRFD
jgi:lipoprotein-releasing system permease protein